VHVERGELAVASERLAAARGLALPAVPGDPGAPLAAGVLAGEGVLALRRGRAEETEARLTEALALDPSNATALVHLGRLRLDQGDADAAVDLLVQAKLADPRSARALRWLGEAYLAQDRHAEAEVQWRAALGLSDSIELLRDVGALLVDGGRWSEAESFVADARRRHASDPRLAVLEGLARQGLGRLDDAVKSLESAVELGADAEARTLLAILLHQLGRRDRAIEAYEQVLAILGDVPLVNLGLGLARFETGAYEEAARRFRLVLDFEPEDTDALLHLGLLEMEYLGDPAAARAHFEAYGEAGGDDPRVGTWLRRVR
jgi:tetratricopeptide (TPR) repeat protein